MELILGSDFTGLAPLRPPAVPSPSVASPSAPAPGSPAPAGASPAASPSASGSAVADLAQSNGGITAAASCASDSSAFAGPLSP